MQCDLDHGALISAVAFPLKLLPAKIMQKKKLFVLKKPEFVIV